MRRYVRIECVNKETEESIGGCISALCVFLACRLGIGPTEDIEFLTEKFQESKDTDKATLYYIIFTLSDLPIPEVYLNDRENYVCLYEEDEFCEVMDALDLLCDMMKNAGWKFTLMGKYFNLEEDEIVYSDGYQIVISKEVYEKHRNDTKYRYICDMVNEMEVNRLMEYEEFDDEDSY